MKNERNKTTCVNNIPIPGWNSDELEPCNQYLYWKFGLMVMWKISWTRLKTILITEWLLDRSLGAFLHESNKSNLIKKLPVFRWQQIDKGTSHLWFCFWYKVPRITAPWGNDAEKQRHSFQPIPSPPSANPHVGKGFHPSAHPPAYGHNGRSRLFGWVKMLEPSSKFS